MRISRPHALAAALALVAGVCVTLNVAAVRDAAAGTSFTRAFTFPASLANGLVADLVPPVGTVPRLSFVAGKVAIGELPIPMPLRLGRHTRGRDPQRFVRLSTEGPHARLLLTGVVDSDGHAVSNSSNQLVIEAVVSPSGAAVNPPPYVIPFDIVSGTAYVDAPVPVARQPGATVTLQILGVSIADAGGEVFGVFGVALGAANSAAPLQPTPTPGGTPSADGQCFDIVTGRCTGQACGAESRCTLPNQLCDRSGRRCPGEAAPQHP